MMRRTILSTTAFIALCAAWSGCYYDKASELYATEQCDTTAVKWSAGIQPIIATQCAYAGCHAGSNPGGGIDLTTYSSVQTQALNGALLGSVAHQSGYDPMPRGSAKLPDCQITKLRIWVAAGALEN